MLAYARGHSCKHSTIPDGLMAAIGLSKEEVTKLLPPGVVIACQNGKESVTISGLAAPTRAFVEQLSSQGIFAKVVKSASIAFHSEYMGNAKENFAEFIKPILKHPKLRTSRWISSSVPPSKADATWTKLNGVEYHVNNYGNTVLFDQVYESIPENAIVIEIAPHGLLQPILRRELGPNTTNLSVTHRSSPDNEEFLLSAIGR